MTDHRYPFPTRDDARAILERDYCFAKIPSEKVDSVVDDAWNCGMYAAERFLSGREEQHLDFADIFRREGVRVLLVDEDYVSGKIRYFAEYQPKRRTVTLYLKSVRLWADANGLELTQAANLILMHEYFHHLENMAPEPTSRRFLVPMLRLGPLSFGTTGIAAMGEIAADAFAWTICKRMNLCRASIEMKDALLRDEAGQTAMPARGIMEKSPKYVFWISIVALSIVLVNIVAVFFLPGWMRLQAPSAQAKEMVMPTWLYLPLSAGAICFFAWLGRRRPEGSRQALIAQGALCLFHVALILQNLL